MERTRPRRNSDISTQVKPKEWNPVDSAFLAHDTLEAELESSFDRASQLLDRAAAPLPTPPGQVELSIVIPCLNEADTVASCVAKARLALDRLGVPGEVIVADNGSRDGSPSLAAKAGAHVVHVEQRGYGSALMGGIAAARGTYVIMGDADDSYDFSRIEPFYRQLIAGKELVQGCRLPSGGGTVLPGAMPVLHRWLGNPVLSFLVRAMFRTPIHDVYCGMRGFRKEWQQSLDQRCTGMEFATEMIIKGTLFGAKIGEVPITLHPDGRVMGSSHLRTFRDGWRTLRFFLLLSPRWTFLVPGAILALLGLLLCGLALPQSSIAGAALDVHTLLMGTLSILVASQLVWCACLAKTFAMTEGLLPRDPLLDRFANTLPLERWLMLSALMIAAGLSCIVFIAWTWASSGFGPLEYAKTLRWVIPGAGLIALGVQCAASSFLMSVLRMARL
jgi:hypothetical protein